MASCRGSIMYPWNCALGEAYAWKPDASSIPSHDVACLMPV